MLLLFPLRKDASRFKASPRVNLTLIHSQAPQKWLNHLSVWSYRLSIVCWVLFRPLGIRSEPSAPWAVPFCRPRRSVKGNYNGMLLNSYLCFTLTFPIFFAFHFPFFYLFYTSHHPGWRLKKKKKEEEERNLTQCCGKHVRLFGGSLGAAPTPPPDFTAFHINQIYRFMSFNEVKVYFHSCAEALHAPNAWEVCSKMGPPDLLFPLNKCRRQQNLSRMFLVVLQRVSMI